MYRYLHLIEKNPLLVGISTDRITEIIESPSSHLLELKRGATVLSEGDTPSQVGIVISGSVCVSRIDEGGTRSIISKHGRLQCFCTEFAASDCETLPVYVTAEKESVVLLINLRALISKPSNQDEYTQVLIYNVMKETAKAATRLHTRSRIISERTTRDKLFSYLRAVSDELQSESFDIPYNRQELAEYLEVDRSGLSVEINKLCREGIIHACKNHYTIVNRKFKLSI